MSEYYDTAINWVAQLEFVEVCALLSIPFFYFLIKILNKTKVRTVPRFYYISLVAITVIMASGLALQNAMYGYEQGTTLFRMAVTGTLFFVGDMLLIAFCYRFFPYWIAVIFGSASIVAFAAMSMFAAFAFLVGQQHLKDNYQVTSKQAQIQRLDAHILTLDPRDKINRRDTLRQITRLNNKIDDLSDDKGGYVSSGSAAYQLIATNSKYTFDQVSMYLRMFWSLAFVIGSMSGGGILAHLRIEASGNKSGSTTTLKNKGTQKDKHNGSNAVDDGYLAVKAWISDHSSGQVLSAKTMRSIMGTTSGNQTIIINRLKSNKLITQGKNGNRAEYKKAGVAVKAKVFKMFGK